MSNPYMESPIPSYSLPIPGLSTKQMIEVDRLMVEEYGILLIQMMENAGRCLAKTAVKRFLSGGEKRKIVVLAGTGGNGGGALVCARRLHNWGSDVQIMVTKPNSMSDVSGMQLNILRKMGLEIVTEINELDQAADLIIDGVIGYSLSGSPSGIAAEMIRWANESNASILSLDTPSGLDANDGQAHDPFIKAAATVTLALPKAGLMLDEVKSIRGELYLADISVPPELYKKISIDIDTNNIFAEADVVRVD